MSPLHPHLQMPAVFPTEREIRVEYTDRFSTDECVSLQLGMLLMLAAVMGCLDQGQGLWVQIPEEKPGLDYIKKNGDPMKSSSINHLLE